MNRNPNCDGAHCTHEHGEVRLLPTGGGGNAILCRACFRHEIYYRAQRNWELDGAAAFDIPLWESLKVYTS
jgi:hypothetical protein